MFSFTDKEIKDINEFIYKHKVTEDSDSLLIDILLKELNTNKGIEGFNDIEKENSNKFYDEHKHCCENILGNPFYSSTGGGFSYIVEWTPVGCLFSMECNSCKTIKNITDHNKLLENYNKLSETHDLLGRTVEQLCKYHPFTFIITPTGLGPCTVIKYTASKDVTDIDCW